MKFKLKLNYIVIPLVTVLVALAGNFFARRGLEWYRHTLVLPAGTPAECVFPIVWTSIYILTTLVALYVYNNKQFTYSKYMITAVLAGNALSTISWNYLFFYKHFIGTAFVNALVTLLTVVVLIRLIYSKSRAAAFLLLPYGIWMIFACYLNAVIWFLN